MSRCSFPFFIGIPSTFFALLQPMPPAQGVEAARTERIAFEQKRGTIILDRDQYIFDRAPSIASDCTIDGRGKAIWRNGFEAGRHPFNSGAYSWPSGASGWVDPITVGANGATVALRDPAQAIHYSPGRLVYVWAAGQGPQPWHPFGVDSSKFGLVNQRRKITERDGAVLTLDSPVDPRVTDICWLAEAQPIGDVPRDSYSMPGIKPGVYWLTSGKSAADELRGEWVEVANEQLKRRTARRYETAALAAMPRVENVTLRGITFAPSPNPLGSTLFAKFVRNWRIEDCTFQGPVLVAGATDIEFVRCRFEAPLQLNTTTRVTLRDCDLTAPPKNGNGIALATDECDCDTSIIGCTIRDTDNGIRSGIGCERMHVRNCTFRRIRLCAFLLGGPDNALEQIRVVGEKESYLHGPRLTIRDYRTVGRTVVFGGDGQRLDGVWANPLILGNWSGGPSSGTYRDCSPVELRPTAEKWTEMP